jgi:Nucleotidyl transferase of unknown function (DUF2204)
MLSTDFKEFIELLNSTQVEYMLVGGYALATYGHPRYTGDMDVWVKPEADNVERLLLVLSAFGFASVGLKKADFMEPEAVVQLGYPPARIDLLTAIDGVTFDACFERRAVVVIDDVTIPVIHIQDFRTNKIAAGRHKDLADLEAIKDQ